MHVVLLARKTLYTQPGGDTVQVEETASALRRCGHEATILTAGQPLPLSATVLHGFNLGRPADLMPYFKSFKGKKILSSIYVDYSLADQQRFPRLYSLLGKHGLEYAKTLGRALNGSDRFPGILFLAHGQKSCVRGLLRLTDLLITSSKSEAQRIESDFGSLDCPVKTVPLGISASFLEPFEQTEKREGLLLLGRLEWLKNQKIIIDWATENNWPLTVVGDANANQKTYYNDCLHRAGSSVSFLPYTAGDALKRILRSHHTLIIPSHFESFSLVGWEAASQGLHVLYNDVADMNETLAPIGTPIQIENKASTVTAITAALNGNLAQKKSHDLLSSRSWDTIILELLNAYA
jgi:hypothetical protein